MKPSEVLVKELAKLTRALLDEKGRELPNPNPLYVEVTPKRLNLQQQIKRLLNTELSRQAYDQGFESFEESNDFEVEDEFDIPESNTQYEILEEETVIEAPPAPVEEVTPEEVEKPEPEPVLEPVPAPAED